MKKVTMYYLKSCPHCQRALGWIDDLIAADAKYGEIEIEKIEESEQPELAELVDYYYVPCFFIEGEKVHEGIASDEIVKDVLDAALA